MVCSSSMYVQMYSTMYNQPWIAWNISRPCLVCSLSGELDRVFWGEKINYGCRQPTTKDGHHDFQPASHLVLTEWRRWCQFCIMFVSIIFIRQTITHHAKQIDIIASTQSRLSGWLKIMIAIFTPRASALHVYLIQEIFSYNNDNDQSGDMFSLHERRIRKIEQTKGSRERISVYLCYIQ